MLIASDVNYNSKFCHRPHPQHWKSRTFCCCTVYMYNFNRTNYCLVYVNCTFQHNIQPCFKYYEFESQVASTGNQLPFLLTAVSRMITMPKTKFL